MVRTGHTTLGVVALLMVSPFDGAAPTHARQQPATVRIVLVGDSTVTDRAGWGHGFRLFLGDGTECVNAAAGGRSSKSYIDEGKWAEALALKGDYYLIQFGHNDQPGKGPERETDPETTYRANLARYVDDVRAIGGQPILVTSLTRRTFKGKRIESSLGPYVEAVRAVGSLEKVPVIDLHASSIALAERMGETAWEPLSPRTANGDVDRTHLNAKGSAIVAPLLVDGLRSAVPRLAPHLRAEPLAGAAMAQRSANAIVAADGTGAYTTVQAAINAAPQNTSADRPWLIFVKAGRYREIVYVQREKRFVTLVGEDPLTTVITYDLHATMTGADGKPIGTFRTPTVTIDADDFSVENLTVENTAGPVGQALALRVDGDRVVFRNSRFLGWQDTIFLNRGRHAFEDSYIAGHVDFIFGGATAFFDRCHIHALRNGYLTAASTPMEQPYGFVFVHGRITGERGVKTYLGRPWRDYAQTTFVATDMSDVVRAEGWHNWDKPEREKTARYHEARNTGPGAATVGRVPWSRPLATYGAIPLTAATVLRGADGWEPSRVPSYPSTRKAVDAPAK
jgi:pectinesterase